MNKNNDRINNNSSSSLEIIDVDEVNKKKEKEELLKQFNFEDYNTLSNFLNIYCLFEKYPHNELIRYEIVRFFIKYHEFKGDKMFDVYGFKKFIINAFFDPSDLVFKQIQHLCLMETDCFILDIYYSICSDKRFNESDICQKRIKEFESAKSGLLIYSTIGPILKRLLLIEKQLKQISNLNRNCTCIECINSKQNYLPNILINQIIGYVLNFYKENIVEMNIHIFKLSLVSKQFFKVLSKQLMKDDSHTFPLLFPQEFDNNNNNNSKFRLIYRSTKTMNYNESFQYIRYNTSKHELNSLFSNVEKFKIDSNEDDYYDKYTHIYKKSVLEDGYLIYPPPMPSLKKLKIKCYCGTTNNYTDFICYLIKNSSKAIQTTTITKYIGAIEHFYLSLSLNYNTDEFKTIRIFKELFKYHSNSMKYIEICFEYQQSLKVILEFFRIYKSLGKKITDKIPLCLWIDDLCISDDYYFKLKEQLDHDYQIENAEDLNVLHSYIKTFDYKKFEK